MKRSKAIKSIANELHDLSLDSYAECVDKAEKILGLVEALGMLPPIEPGRTEQDLDLGAPLWEQE